MEINLKELQKVELEILLEVDRICREYNITYQLFSGTLLGAVRHKGFIPWDDDIDICLLRKDYDKFIDICNKNLNSKYFLQHYENDKNSIYSFSRVRKNGTLIEQSSWIGLEMNKGIFIDIFPMDNILPNKLSGKVQKILLYIIKKIKPLKIKNIAYNSRFTIYKYIKILIYNILRPISIQSINRIETRIACMFNNKDTEFSTCLTDSNIKGVYDNFMIENKKFNDVIDMKFENHIFPIPRNYHEVLTKNYGEYMTFPPIDEQKPHHEIAHICFDTRAKKIEL